MTDEPRPEATTPREDAAGPSVPSPDESGPTWLDGPMGSELERRGVALPAPLWTARAVAEHPDVVQAVHAAWAAAGARVHTTATFRTTARACRGSGLDGEALARRAVALARAGAGSDGVVAGSLAPLEDCYHPERTPGDAALHDEHAALAGILADAGVDLLLVETMPTLRELVAACEEAVAASAGRPVWAAITLGPDGSFFSTEAVADAAAAAAGAGAEAFLVNCTPPDAITPLLEHLAARRDRPPRLGAYGNRIFAGGDRWTPERYAGEAARWQAAGADILGGCCGTTPDHLRALIERCGAT